MEGPRPPCRGWRPIVADGGRVTALLLVLDVRDEDDEQAQARESESLTHRAPGQSALALLVAEVLADHHDPAVTADHLALVADRLDARLDLHVQVPFERRRQAGGAGSRLFTCTGRRSARGSGRTG